MSGVAPHRRFVSVELPFCLPVTTTRSPSSHGGGLREEDRRMVEAFVPPSFLRPALDEVSPSVGEGAAEDQAETPTQGVESGKKLHKHIAGIALASEYCTGEVFSGWRPLDFEAEAENPQQHGSNKGLLQNTCEEGKWEREKMLRESFPSFAPQVLLQGFYRNDVLVEVTRTRCVKRLRDPFSGRVVREMVLPEEGDSHREPKAKVVGVVSREVDLVRPADFCFGPFSKEALAAAPALCSGTLFPPAHFVAEKTPFEVECEFGGHFKRQLSKPPGGDATSEEKEDGPLEWEFEAMPTLSVMANDPNIPPPMLPAQRDLLQRLNGGDAENECVEVRTMKQLLDERPVWITQELLDAVLQSGVCPRRHINKKAMSCLTYVIKNGPFNRLRVRLGFDPYANHATASLQRIAVKINRRSELGTLLRDISRVPHIADVMREIEKKRTEDAQTKEDGDTSRLDCLPCRPRGSFFAKLSEVIKEGRLYLAFQLVDLSDDMFLRELLLRLPAAIGMPLEQRTGRNGWIGEAGYQRASLHIAEALADLIKSEVAPALEGWRSGGGSSTSTTLAGDSGTDSDNEEDEQDAESFDSAASDAATSLSQQTL
ncbi:hypothetical protein TraAM80_06371 [Trypanosoma rangeli]|uniref:Transcription factor IIIC subunit 5 HTH domain-containing protein n=1 Tax=Trypanosoma rangeli TaxID=5698 RepID=A0A422NAG1_TRYRA|nr:uncharacterized protein TraAM80_06371 [Trypanosoma rangeli]RNF02464.1 hypothetical protein TraAM80_06371 [Trypanosoma rangeli]|eukprot:RNF02464.1 hypothetical protein TraAM80_06371 [Trypanosoma rangeli]